MRKPHPFMHIVTEDEQAPADLIQNGDGIRWVEGEAAGEGVVWGTAGQDWRGEYIISLFNGQFAIPLALCSITEVWRGEARLWPAPAKQLRLF